MVSGGDEVKRQI